MKPWMLFICTVFLTLPSLGLAKAKLDSDVLDPGVSLPAGEVVLVKSYNRAKQDYNVRLAEYPHEDAYFATLTDLAAATGTPLAALKKDPKKILGQELPLKKNLPLEEP